MNKSKPHNTPNAYQRAVAQTPQLGAVAYHFGLKAIRGKYGKRITFVTAQILGSVDLDATLESHYPNDSRWDYGIGVQKDGKALALWVEFHPAQTSNVEEVLKKLRWLKNWLGAHAPALLEITPSKSAYHWLATNGVHIIPNSPQARRLAQEGLTLPRKTLNLDALRI